MGNKKEKEAYANLMDFAWTVAKTKLGKFCWFRFVLGVGVCILCASQW